MIRCSRKFQSRAIVLKWLYEFLGTLFVHCVMCSDLRKDIQKVERKKHFFVNELLNRRSVCSGNEKSLPRCVACARDVWKLHCERFCVPRIRWRFISRGFCSYVISEVRHHDTIFLPKTKGFQNFRRVYPMNSLSRGTLQS